MSLWKIAAVQTNPRLGDKAGNLTVIRARLEEAARLGARLVVFPECALTGYCFDSKDEAWPHGETIPGPSTSLLAEDCRRLGVWAALGMLEQRPADGALFNACALVSPQGEIRSYRKIHLPFLGVDRFTTPGDRPFEVHDLGGLRLGILICYDGGFPESARCLMLQGADLVILPTNYPTGALSTLRILVPARALENWIYLAVVNRTGEERGFRFIGQSRIVDVTGEIMATATEQGEEIVLAEVDPERARRKRIVHIPGKYELDRVKDRRPGMYGPINVCSGDLIQFGTTPSK